jgi:hypothetical protein
MKNDKIVASWSAVGPDGEAEERMLAAILERNREVAAGRRETGAEKGFWRRMAAAAACVAVILAIGVAVGPVGKLTGRRGNGEEQSGLPSPTIPLTGVVSGEVPNGITIPAIPVPGVGGGASADMVPLVVYRGHVYKMSGVNSGEGSSLREEMVGEYLGRATGTIDEWSTKKDYEKELAATVWGDVYTVKGYDPDFRICVRDEYQQGKIDLYDRLNGIRLFWGSELFEDRLRLPGRVTAIRYQVHDDWNNSLGNVHYAAIPKEVWEAFLDAVNFGWFVDAQPEKGSFYADKPESSIYDTPNQAHLFLTLEDGIVVELRLIDGGYVGYEGCFVRIPEDVFNTVYDVCGGTH